jgi:hypothetical protein
LALPAPSICTEASEANKDLHPDTTTGWSSTIKTFVSNFWLSDIGIAGI